MSTRESRINEAVSVMRDIETALRSWQTCYTQAQGSCQSKQNQIDNAVRLYCAQLTTDAIYEVEGAVRIAGGNG